MSKRGKSPPKMMDPSRNPDGSFRSREEYERALREPFNPPPVSQGFARSTTDLSEDLSRRRYHPASEDEMVRREEMQRPPPRAPSPKGQVGTISAHILRSRLIAAEYERARQAQLAFYAMLEQKYGAVKGDDHSYLVAMERYEYDKEKERKKQAKVAAGTMVPFQSEAEMEAVIRGLDEEVRTRLHNATWANQRADAHWRAYDREKARKEEEEIERLRQEAERLRREYEERKEHERRRREQEYHEFQERERLRRQYEYERERQYQEQQQYRRQQQQQQQQQRQQQHQSHARGSRAPSPPRRDEPESPKSALNRRYPLPETRPAAFAVLGIPASATSREIKKAYHHGAMLLHPDKNPTNQDEATIRFQQIQKAYNILNPQGGGRRKRHTRSRRHKSRKITHRHRGKTNRRPRRHRK
jgi:hypothetical protein